MKSFELTNRDREYLGLDPLEEHWEAVALSKEVTIYFDGDTIKRQIIFNENGLYDERHMNEETEDRKVLLPKTKRGKPKKLTYSSFNSRNGYGVYFRYDGSFINIGNITTEKMFYSNYHSEQKPQSFEELRAWLDLFIAETTPAHLKALETFKTEERKNIKYKVGDFFAFKISRDEYGFGRILEDIPKLRKTAEFKKKKHYGLNNIMARPLVVKVYHTISPTKEVDIEHLKTLKSFPAQYIMDNNLFYGEYEIIGNLPLEDEELDFLISCSQSLSHNDPHTTYFQWGMIYIEEEEQNSKNMKFTNGDFRNDGIGAVLNINYSIVKEAIKKNSNDPFWDSRVYYAIERDIRSPKHNKIRDEMLLYYGLDAHKSYVENLAIYNQNQIKEK